MPTLGGILLTFKEAGYIAFHAGWSTQPGDQLYERIALNNMESLLHTGAYRPASQNGFGGIDWGWEMENDVNGPFASRVNKADISPKRPTLDPFLWFDPVYATRKSLEYAKANPTQPFRPWAYGYIGAPRTSTTISLGTVKTAVGPLDTLYSEANSPYWRMLQAGMAVDDLPQPPLVYYSRLPAPVLKYGDSYKEGRVNQLQRILQEDGRYTGGLDNYFGPRTRGDTPNTGGVKSVQRDFQTWGVWDGPTDGVYSAALFEIWDAMLEFDFYTRWG